MLSRADFIFTIGYDGPHAVVDSQAKRRCGALSARELAERGLYRAAYASVVYDRWAEARRADGTDGAAAGGAAEKDGGGAGRGPRESGWEADLAALVEIYNRNSGSRLTVDSPLDRLFGVFPIEVKRAVIL
ncbi:MAG: hypothetical protein LBO76_07675 [Treponema sp.]|jgi:hypothetical protein|nr:hypothetical protein [Treponema sp.]